MSVADDLRIEVARLRELADEHEAAATEAEALGSAEALREQGEALRVQARDAWGRPDRDGQPFLQQAQLLEDRASLVEAAPMRRSAAAVCRAEALALEAAADREDGA